MTINPGTQLVDIFLARHASPGALHPGLVYHLPPGPSLSKTGEAEAEALADFLYSRQVKKIMVSPLERTLQTAAIIHQKYAIPVMVRDGLKELIPGEQSDQVYQRAWPVFEEACVDQPDSGPVTLLTHGGVIYVLLKALGLRVDEIERFCLYDHHNPIPPAGAWQVSSSPGQTQWAVRLTFTPNAQVEEVTSAAVFRPIID